MKLNVERAREYSEFAQGEFTFASPDKQRAIAKALGGSYAFYGIEKRIAIDLDPLLLAFASYARGKNALIEPPKGRSHKRKQASREETLVFGGPAHNLTEPASGADIGKPKGLPPALLEALRGPLFPDLGLGRGGIEGEA